MAESTKTTILYALFLREIPAALHTVAALVYFLYGLFYFFGAVSHQHAGTERAMS